LVWNATYVPLFLLTVITSSFGGTDNPSNAPRRRVMGQLLTWADSRAVATALGVGGFGGRYFWLTVSDGRSPSLIGRTGTVVAPVRVIVSAPRGRWTALLLRLPGGLTARFVIDTDLLPPMLRTPTP
jgi:hypothetical protein